MNIFFIILNIVMIINIIIIINELTAPIGTNKLIKIIFKKIYMNKIKNSIFLAIEKQLQ